MTKTTVNISCKNCKLSIPIELVPKISCISGIMSIDWWKYVFEATFSNKFK